MLDNTRTEGNRWPVSEILDIFTDDFPINLTFVNVILIFDTPTTSTHRHQR